MVRLRIAELLEERGLTPYYLSKQSAGRISLSTAYRLLRLHGVLKSFDADVLDALCDVLAVEPGELFEREAGTARAPKPGRVRRK
jgi:DNA-binding Xre family transcriptional regulator